MRGFVAIWLLAVFCLPFVSSSLALGQDTDAGLPACCRRTGQHHCAMGVGERLGMAAPAAQAARWKAPAERCPYCPATVAAGVHADAVWISADTAAIARVPAVISAVRRAECAHRLARERARGKRGPPLSLLV